MNTFKRNKLTCGELGGGGGVKKEIRKKNGQLLHPRRQAFLFTSRPGGPHLALPSDPTLSTPAPRELLIEPRKRLTCQMTLLQRDFLAW